MKRTFGSNSVVLNQAAWASDATGTYFVDNGGLQLLRLRGAGPAQLVRDLAADGLRGITHYVHLTDGHIVVSFTDFVGAGLLSVGKGGDSYRVLVPSASDTFVLASGAVGDEVVYGTRNSSSGLVTLKRMSAGGGAPRTVATSIRMVANLPGQDLQPGATEPRAAILSAVPYGPPPVARLKALLYCTPAPGIEDCRNADLYRQDLATGATVKVATMVDGLSRRDSFNLTFEWTALGTPQHEWPLYADLPGTFASLATGAGTVPAGGFVANGRWLDRYLLTGSAAARASKLTNLAP